MVCLSVLSTNPPVTQIRAKDPETGTIIPCPRSVHSVNVKLNGHHGINFSGRKPWLASSPSSSSGTRLRAGFAEIEPDLNEDPIDRYATPGIDPEDFKYGEYDGHHTYHEGEETRTFWELIAEDIKAVEAPTGFQGFISWLFLPAIAAGMFFNVPGEYLFIGAGLFTIVFCIIEMDKPDKPHNFEPQIYNMERGARDKLINDYNTMSIWDFNEKYGELWDFTIKRDDLTKL